MNLQEHLERADKSINEITQHTSETKKKRIVVADVYSGDTCVEVPAATSYDIEYLHQRLDWIREDINYLRESFYNHQKGHLPALSYEALSKALKLLGIEGVEIAKQYIYAGDGSIKGENYLLVSK